MNSMDSSTRPTYKAGYRRYTWHAFALTQLLMNADFKERIDRARIAAIGHSSGGATAKGDGI
jgi:hypothetical protein